MNIIDEIKKVKIIPVVKISNREDSISLMAYLLKGGLNVVEITLRTPVAIAVIQEVSQFSRMIVGAGTVLNIEQAKLAIKAGAKFIVTPGFDLETVLYCQSQNILVIPGVATPTEVMKAIKYDLGVVKFFPAEAFGGTKTLKAFLGPFPNMKFIPTGGIDLSNVQDYLSLRNVIACGGSWMVKEELLNEKKFELITNLAKETLMKVQGLN